MRGVEGDALYIFETRQVLLTDNPSWNYHDKDDELLGFPYNTADIFCRNHVGRF